MEGAGGLLPFRCVGEPGQIRDHPVWEEVPNQGGPALPDRVLNRLTLLGIEDARDQLNKLPRRNPATKRPARGGVPLGGEKERGHQILLTRKSRLRSVNL